MVLMTITRVQRSVESDSRSDPSEILTDVYAVCIRILEHEAP